MQNAKLGKLESNLLMLGIFLCMELGLMVSSEFTVAMPKIIAELGGANLYALVFTANLAMSAIAAPIAGKLSDIFGRRRILLISIGIIFVSEAVTGFVQNIYQLMVMRGLQGIGGSATVVIGIIAISDIFKAETRAKYLGFYGSMNALTSVIAPLAGGFFVQYMSWRWVFYSILPVGVLGIYLVARYMPVIPRSKETKIDYLGLMLYSLIAIMLVLTTSMGGKTYPWGSPTMFAMYGGMVAAIVLFILAEKNSSNPMMPLSLFRYRVFNICLISVFLCMAASMALNIYLPLLWQKVMGLSPTQSGLLLTTKGLVAMVFGVISGYVVARLKYFKWNAVVGAAVFAAVIYGYYSTTDQTSYAVLVTLALIWGTIAAVVTSIFQTGVQMALPNDVMGVAMGTMQIGVTMGATIASAVFGILIKNPVLSVGIHNVLLTCFVIVAVVLVLLVLFIPKKPSAQSQESLMAAESTAL